jgi:hypothetical protein
MAGTDSIVGTYGEMPIDMYLRQLEVTDMFESPDLVEDYQRQLLKDRRPDQPFFESDIPRGGLDPNTGERLRGYQSYGVLALRETGKRSYAEPELPDGTFLDYQFLQPDERGVAVGPDMRKHRDQQMARGKFYNYRSDADWSVPESGWQPSNAIRQMKWSMYPLKDRMKIFSSSRTASFGARGTDSRPQLSQLCIQTPEDAKWQDGGTPEIVYKNRLDATTILSNSLPIGSRVTTDNRFKVAKYGQIRADLPFSKQDWWRNRAHVYDEREIPRELDGIRVPKNLALLIANLSRRKMTSIWTGLQNMFKSSKDMQLNRQRKITAEDLELIRRLAEESGVDPAHVLLKGEVIPRDAKRLRDDEEIMDKVVINPKILSIMASTGKNRKSRGVERKDLRKEVERTSLDEGIFVMDKESNKKPGRLMKSTDPLQRKNIDTYYVKGEEKNISNYKNLPAEMKNSKIPLHRAERYKEISRTNKYYKINPRHPKNRQIDDVEGDMDFQTEGYLNRFINPAQTRYTTPYIAVERIEECDDMNDI